MRFAPCGLESHKAIHKTQSLRSGLYSLVSTAWPPQPGIHSLYSFHSFHSLASAPSTASSAWPLQPGIHRPVSRDRLTLKPSPRLALHGFLQDAHSKVCSAQGPKLQDCPTSRQSPPRIKAPYSKACSTPRRSPPRIKTSPGACSRTEPSPRTKSPPGTQENHWGKVPRGGSGCNNIVIVLREANSFYSWVSPFMVFAIRQACCPNVLFLLSVIMGVEFNAVMLGISNMTTGTLGYYFGKFSARHDSNSKICRYHKKESGRTDFV